MDKHTAGPFAIYWSAHWPMAVFGPNQLGQNFQLFMITTDCYAAYLSEKKIEWLVTETILSRAAIKVAWLQDRSVSDHFPTIFDLCPKPKTVCDLGCGAVNFLRICELLMSKRRAAFVCFHATGHWQRRI